MSDMNPIGEKVMFGYKRDKDGKKIPLEYNILFSVSAINEIQEYFGIPLAELDSALSGTNPDLFNNLCYILFVLINKEIKCVNEDTGASTPPVPLEYITDRLEVNLMKTVTEQIYRAIRNDLPQDEDGENPPTGQ